jgi:2-methylcitrate dehydratase PrpD
MGLTAELSQFVAALRIEALPPPLIERACQLVLDLVGNIVRAQSVESTPALKAAVRDLGLTSGHCHVFGDSASYAPAGAALVNGVLAHSLDFDDTHAESTLHPGAAVIPAALAAAEMGAHSGAAALAGIIAGYEMTCRLGVALPGAEHYARGFHPSSTCGAFGAAAAAARIFGLDSRGVSAALGIALSQSAGTLQFLENGAWTKRFQVGWAAMAGLTAAVLAREGFKGAEPALEGRYGFLKTYAPAPTPERAAAELGRRYEIMATGVKPYPSCRYGHAGIDAALALRLEHDLTAEQIESVVYGLSHAGMRLVAMPPERKVAPQNIVDAQFSAPFVLAMVLATGRMDWDSYARLGDAQVRALAQRVRCEHDAEIEAEYPVNMSGRLTVHARGQRFVKTVIVPKGEPGNFLTPEELRRKFSALALPTLGAERTSRLATAILEMPRAGGVAALFGSGTADS